MFFKINVFKNLKETPKQVFSLEYCEIFKGGFFIEHHRWLFFLRIILSRVKLLPQSQIGYVSCKC